MNTVERKQKLQTLPWYALHDIALQKKIEEKEVNGKEKSAVIDKILSYGSLSDDEIESYVNDYIYGDRVTFTLWTFQNVLNDYYQTLYLIFDYPYKYYTFKHFEV